MVGLADCNNFFVSCERTLNPALENRAVVVLSNNDGCVVARSNEAKRAGIKMGQPAFQIKDRIQSGEIIALSGNHLLYREISIKVHDIFRRYAPNTLDYSVDEAFLLMDGIPDSQLRAIGEAIAANCWDELHIPVTIGFAPSKT
ncbi:MAG: SOS mutagenesis and repair protein UmuC, partial [Muribaculaceae bacterium]|nr:SOS mutagenesis and repair protein UmuC [Muribaculaceae bacterium]